MDELQRAGAAAKAIALSLQNDIVLPLQGVVFSDHATCTPFGVVRQPCGWSLPRFTATCGEEVRVGPA